MIPKAWKDQWLTDLRSGEFKQCHGAMFRNGACCALGVLNLRQGYVTSGVLSYPNVCEHLPWSQARHIIEMNDRQLKTFPEIAEWIDTNVGVADETPTTGK